MLSAPCELNLGGVYVPPLLVAGLLGLTATFFLTRLLTRYRLSRHFASPALVFVALVILLSGLIETFFF